MRFRLSALANLVADVLDVRTRLSVERTVRPLEVSQVRGVDTVLEGIVLSRDLLVDELLPDHTGLVLEVGHSVDGLHGETESIRAVSDGELERGIDVSLFVVASNVDVGGSLSLVNQAVNEEGVRVEVEDDGLVVGEDRVELVIGQSVGMVLVAGQLEQVDNIDESDLEIGKVSSQQGSGGERFLGDDVTTRSHDHIGLFIGAGTGPFPDPDTLGAVGDGRVHVEVLQVGLLVGNNDVDVVGGLQAVVHDLCKGSAEAPTLTQSTHRSQTVRVGRQVDSGDVL
jgi:hypothetical protein